MGNDPWETNHKNGHVTDDVTRLRKPAKGQVVIPIRLEFNVAKKAGDARPYLATIVI